eukprot:3937884-Rhodomonas_salina.2
MLGSDMLYAAARHALPCYALLPRRDRRDEGQSVITVIIVFHYHCVVSVADLGPQADQGAL